MRCVRICRPCAPLGNARRAARPERAGRQAGRRGAGRGRCRNGAAGRCASRRVGRAARAQAVVDKSAVVASAVLVSAMHLLGSNAEIVKRWTNEIQEAIQSRHAMVQFHAVALLHALRASDRLAVSKLVSSLTRGAVRSPLAQCLLVRRAARAATPPGGAGAHALLGIERRVSAPLSQEAGALHTRHPAWSSRPQAKRVCMQGGVACMGEAARRQTSRQGWSLAECAVCARTTRRRQR